MPNGGLATSTATRIFFALSIFSSVFSALAVCTPSTNTRAANTSIPRRFKGSITSFPPGVVSYLPPPLVIRLLTGRLTLLVRPGTLLRPAFCGAWTGSNANPVRCRIPVVQRIDRSRTIAWSGSKADVRRCPLTAQFQTVAFTSQFAGGRAGVENRDGHSFRFSKLPGRPGRTRCSSQSFRQPPQVQHELPDL